MRRRSLLISVVLVALVLAAGLVSAGATSTVAVSHVENWGSGPGLDDGEFTHPQDVAVDKWGRVYVTGNDTDDHRVQMFSSAGEFVTSAGATGFPNPNPAVLDRPRSVTTDRWGNVWVSERGNSGRLSRFHPGLYGGTPASSWTGSGAFPDDIADPLGIAVALDGTVYTVMGSSYAQRWSSGGTYLNAWTTGGPTFGIAVSQDGTVYVSNDAGSGTSPSHVMAYTSYGGFITSWGGFGTDPGQFQRPYDLGVDPAGNVFTIDSQAQRAQAFTPNGTFLTSFGSGGTGAAQFQFPYGIGVGLDRTLFVADTFNHRISKWEVEVPATTAPIAGGSRYATAAAASQKAFPTGSESEYVVIATGRNWPDALGGAALAGALKAPLLLTGRDTLAAEVTAEIDRLNVQEIYVLGGVSAVSAAVYDELAALVGPGDIERLSGGNRYETANAIAEEVAAIRGPLYDGTAFVVTGRSFPDALAVSPIAAANGWPILLTDPNALPASVRTSMETIGANHGYIIGGTGAVSEAVEDELNDHFIEFARYGGTNRYTTAALVAEVGFDGMGMLWSRPAIATGRNFPDALAGGVLQGSDYSVMLLSPPDSLHPAAAAALEANAESIYELRFLGGESALSPAVRASAAALLP